MKFNLKKVGISLALAAVAVSAWMFFGSGEKKPQQPSLDAPTSQVAPRSAEEKAIAAPLARILLGYRSQLESHPEALPIDGDKLAVNRLIVKELVSKSKEIEESFRSGKTSHDLLFDVRDRGTASGTHRVKIHIGSEKISTEIDAKKAPDYEVKATDSKALRDAQAKAAAKVSFNTLSDRPVAATPDLSQGVVAVPASMTRVEPSHTTLPSRRRLGPGMA